MVKKWKKYRKHFFSGIWHVHTSYTDGKNTVEEMCEEAKALGTSFIAFTEHVRKELTYNFEEYFREVKECGKKLGIEAIAGIEAKVLNDGSLNASKKVLKKAEVIFGVIHDKVKSEKEYFDKVKKLLDNDFDVWGHPTLALKRSNIKLKKEEIERLVSMLEGKDIVVEINLRHEVPSAYFIGRCIRKDIPLLLGLDAHSKEELRKYWG